MSLDIARCRPESHRPASQAWATSLRHKPASQACVTSLRRVLEAVLFDLAARRWQRPGAYFASKALLGMNGSDADAGDGLAGMLLQNQCR